MPALLKLFQNTEEEETVLISYYEASITLIPKPDKNITREKRHRSIYIPDEYRCENSQLLELLNEFTKVKGYKIYMQKLSCMSMHKE